MFIEIVLIFLYTTKLEIMTIVSNFISIPSLLLFNLKEKLLNVSLSAVERIPVRRSHVPPNFKFAFSILIRALCCPNRIYYSFMAFWNFYQLLDTTIDWKHSFRKASPSSTMNFSSSFDSPNTWSIRVCSTD